MTFRTFIQCIVVLCWILCVINLAALFTEPPSQSDVYMTAVIMSVLLGIVASFGTCLLWNEETRKSEEKRRFQERQITNRYVPKATAQDTPDHE